MTVLPTQMPAHTLSLRPAVPPPATPANCSLPGSVSGEILYVSDITGATCAAVRAVDQLGWR